MLFLVSIVAGFVSAMSGMGGGVILIPAPTRLGMDIKHASAISSGTRAGRRSRTKTDPRSG